MAENKLVVSLALKADNYKSQVSSINKETQKLSSEIDKAASEVDGFGKTLKEQELRFQKISLELDKNKALLKTYSTQLDKCKATVKEANTAYKEQEKEVESLRKELESAKKTYGENSKEVKSLEKELKEAEFTLKKKKEAVISATNSMMGMETQINKTEIKINDLNSALNGANWSKFGASAEDLGNKISKAGDGITDVGKKVSVASVGMTGAMAGAAKVSIEFEQAMSKVKSTSGASAEEIEQLSKHAEQLGKDIKGASANEIAKSYDYLALAGYKAKDMMASMESVVKANIAFGGDMATTADLMTDSLSAMGKGAEDASHYLDVVAQTSRNANTSGIELMEAYIEVGGTLNNLGVELAESAKILAVMADNGLKGSEAGRSLQSVLVNLMGTTSTTKGALETLGVEVYDNEGKFRGLSTVLEEVVNSTSTMTDEQADMTLALLGGKTQLTALNNMLKSTDGSYDDLTEAISNSDGALEEMYLTMSDNTAGTFADLSSKLETVAKQFGDLLLPVLNQVVEAAIVVAEWIAGLSTEMKTTILAIGALIAAIGPLIIIIGSLISNIGVIIATFGSLSTAIGTAGGLMPWFSATILPVIATIGSLIAIVVTLYMSIKENWEGIKEATNNLVENCKPYFEQLKEAFSNLWQTCQDICNTVIQPLFKIIGEVIAECINFVSPILNLLMVVFSNVCNYISTYWNSIGKPVFSAIMSIVQTVWSVVQPIFNSISTLFSSIVNAISSVWNGIGMPIFNTIISIVGKVASAVTPAFNTFKNVIISAMNAVLSPIQFVIDKISTLLNWISNASSKVSSFVSSLNPFKSILGKSIDNGISMGDAAAVAPALSGSYYTADSIKSRNYVNSANKLASSIGNMSTSGISVNNNMDTSKLEELMMNMINLLTTQNTLIQANKPVFNLDGQQLSNKLDKISGENMRLYERFNV